MKCESEKCAKSGFLLVCSPWKLCAGISLGLGARLIYRESAFCKAQPPSRIIQRRPNVNDDNSKFDWKRLFEYLKPHKWLLVAAVVVSTN